MSYVKQKKFLCYDINIKVLSAVHIGTGEPLDPFQYIIDDKNVFHRFNMEDILDSFNEQQTKNFNEAVKLNNLHHLRKFIKNNFDKKISLYSYNIDKNTAAEYNKRISDPSAQSYMEIYPTMRQPGGTPFIPGSSIKGAIRTAVLDSCVSNTDKAPKEDKYRDYEGKILGALSHKGKFNVAGDPFNNLKISDCMYPDNENNIMLAKITNLGSKGDGVEQLCEILLPLNQHRKSSVATGTLSIETGMAVNGKLISIEDIAEKCKTYFLNTLKIDYDYFVKLGNQSIIQQINTIKQKINDMNNFTLPLRLGRFCGKHSMTFSNALNREPSTRNLAYKIYPLGWVALNWQRKN